MEEVVLEGYAAPEDTNPPVLTLNLGDGERAITTNGTFVVVHRYPQFSPRFVHPGATAFDLEDGNLTSRISSFGVGAIDMDVTTDEKPYVISYQVQDSSGNTAKVTIREDFYDFPCT